MLRKATKHTRTVKVLKNANPSFVSLVHAGANGTPLNVVKSDAPVQETTMSKKNATDIHHLVFAASTFKSEEQVKDWLTQGGYTDCVIKADAAGFVVDGDGDVPDPEELDLGEGVTAFVGIAVEDASAAKGDVTALEGTKTETPTTGAQKEGEAELQPVATEGAKADPAMADATAGTDKGNDPMSTTGDMAAPAAGKTQPHPAAGQHKGKKKPVAGETEPDTDEDKNVAPKGKVKAKGDEPAKPSDVLPTLLAKDENGVISVVSRKASFYTVESLADVIGALSWIKQDMQYDAFFGTGDDADTKAGTINAVIKQLGEMMIAMTQQIVENASKGEETLPADASTEASKAVLETTVAGSAAEKSDASKQESSADPVQVAMLAALGTLTTAVKGLGEQMASLSTKSEQNAEQASKLAERLVAVESTGQSQKSAAIEDFVASKPKPAGAAKTDEEISKELQSRNALAMLGM